MEGTSIWWGNVNTFTGFSNWQTSSVEDANSLNANPLFVNLGDTPPNFDTLPSSPTIGAGSTSLSCSVGWCDPNGSSPNSIYGSTDFLGNPRTNGSNIDIGAYENTGAAIDNSLTVNLTSGTYILRPGQSTTLTVTVSARHGGGGVPSGTVNFMLGSNLAGTANAAADQRHGVSGKFATQRVTARARCQHVNRRVLGECDRALLSGIRTAGYGVRKLNLGTNHRNEKGAVTKTSGASADGK